MGVLVAISIPIFNAQLKKARVATNQANARAAYAAATADYLMNGDDSASKTYQYTIADGKTTTTSSSGTATVGKDISAWSQSGNSDNDTMGKKTYPTWYITLGSDGSVSSISYSEN